MQTHTKKIWDCRVRNSWAQHRRSRCGSGEDRNWMHRGRHSLPFYWAMLTTGLQYMRNHRAGQATFIPLDTIQVKPINDKYRSFAKGARLAVDVIQYEPAVERAMHYACGNALVCDTMDVARYVCYEKGQEVKGENDSREAMYRSVLKRKMWHSRYSGRNDYPQERSDYWWTEFAWKQQEVGRQRHPRYLKHFLP